MNKQTHSRNPRTRKSQVGMSLLETMFAVFILLVVAVNVMAMAFTAITTTENQGHLAARTAEYAQDKMEQLLALRYCDGSTNTAIFPSTPAGGYGLGAPAPNTASCVNPGNPAAGIPPDPRVPGGTAGGLNPAAPVAGYVDYLCVDGSYLGTNTCTVVNWYYVRLWQITNPAGAGGNNLKQITILCQVRSGIGNRTALPQSTVTSMKSYPF